MSKQTEIFEFADADLVRKLCGPNHANLALIEEAFGVTGAGRNSLTGELV